MISLLFVLIFDVKKIQYVFNFMQKIQSFDGSWFKVKADCAGVQEEKLR